MAVGGVLGGGGGGGAARRDVGRFGFLAEAVLEEDMAMVARPCVG